MTNLVGTSAAQFTNAAVIGRWRGNILAFTRLQKSTTVFREPVVRRLAEIVNATLDRLDQTPEYFATDAEIAAGITIVNHKYPPGHVFRYGVTGDGFTKDDAAIVACLALGGDIYFPAGRYLIPYAGADAGGAYATITKSIRVTCHPDAVFFTDGVDNDMIRMTVPTDGTGLPADGIDVEWYGGVFDKRNQKNSTVIPFIAFYPAYNPGSSGTCDGLSIRGAYTSASVEYHGIRRTIVEGVTFIGSDHWGTAGGDSGVFMEGARLQIARHNRAVGMRDLGVYGSSSPSATLDVITHIHDNEFLNCMHGAAVKRSTGDTSITGNTFINCVRGAVIVTVTGSGSEQAIIANNTGRNCGVPIYLEDTVNFTVHDNVFKTLGALLEDGTTVEDVVGCNGMEFIDVCTDGFIHNNRFLGIQSGVATAYPGEYDMLHTEANSTRLTFRDNIGDSLRTAGNDAGTYNSFIDNYVTNAATTAHVTTLDTTSFGRRVDPTTMRRGYESLVEFADGSDTGPSIARRAQTAVGLYFGTSKIGMTVGSGVKRFECDGTANRFYGKPIAPAAATTFGAADTTPSVANGNYFYTGTSSLTISDFDDGIDEQEITVISKGAITYDTTGTNLVGSSIDIVTASGDVTKWVRDSTVWRLVAFVDVSVDNSAGA